MPKTFVTLGVMQGIVEEIAEHMSLFGNHEYFDIEADDE